MCLSFETFLHKRVYYSFSKYEVMQRAVLRGAVTSSVGKGIFHVRTKPVEQPMTILKYRLQPQYTPVPLRFRYASSYKCNWILNWGRSTSPYAALLSTAFYFKNLALEEMVVRH